MTNLPTCEQYFTHHALPDFPYWRPSLRYIVHIDCALAEIFTKSKEEALAFLKANGNLYVQSIEHNPNLNISDYRVLLTEHPEGNENFDIDPELMMAL